MVNGGRFAKKLNEFNIPPKKCVYLKNNCSTVAL